MALKLDDLKFGTMNRCSDDNATGVTGDPRRTKPLTSLRRTSAETYAVNTTKNRSEWEGIVVLTYPIDFAGYSDTAGLLKQYQQAVNIPDQEKYKKVQAARKFAYKVFVPELDCRPVPAVGDPNDPITVSLSEIYANIPGLEQELSPGTAVVVHYQDPASLYGGSIVRIHTNQLQVENTSYNQRTGGGRSGFALKKAFDQAATRVPNSSQGGSNVIFTQLLPNAQEISPTQEIISDPPFPPGLTATVERELAFWNGRQECDSDETKNRLNIYWSNIGLDGRGHCKDWAWSAAYISYVIMQHDPGFGGARAHTTYAKNAKNGVSDWTLWKAQPGIKAQVGDILVYPNLKPGAADWASHGDVVYKVQNKKAYLAGGNLSDTSRGGAPGDSKPAGFNYLTLNLDDEGTYSDFHAYKQNYYQIVLKKNGRVQSRGLGLMGTPVASNTPPISSQLPDPPTESSDEIDWEVG